MEYWVINPTHHLTFAYHLDVATPKFIPTLPVLTDEDFLKSSTFKGVEIELAALFSAE